MNTGRKRRLATAKPGVSRSKCSKTEENERRQSASTRPSSPECELRTFLSSGEINHENTTLRRAGKISRPCSQPLGPASVNEDKAKSGRRKGHLKKKQEKSGSSTEAGSQREEVEEGNEEDEIQPEVEIDQELDRELESKSRQHNLTSANVRSIIHEVITNEHVVAMLKAAINDTEPVPLFEPKMTRSRLKEVEEKGVMIPAWNISPIKKPSKEKGPQFVDIPLEEEDSSDEEYCPDEEEDDETAEDTLLESDMESTASSPRGTRISLSRSFSECDGENSCSPRQTWRRTRHLRVEVVPMGPPPPPQSPPGPSRESSFMEKLHAVDEELAIGSDCMDSYQPISSSGEESLMAFRTRSKRPLRDVPLGRLEAELRAPDITPDMYEHGSAHEDVEWTRWLQGLMCSDGENEEEADDEDDPEYNFLADIDEPDVEDYRNDKAVRITKKEVNSLMEELFDTFQDELGGPDEEGHEEEEEKEEEDTTQQEAPSILETIPYENPLADILKQRYRTVKEQLAALRKRKAFLQSKGVPIPPPAPKPPPSPTGPLFLTYTQKLHLQQHVQQHVQLLAQVNMLSRSGKGLQTEASTARKFLLELQFFAQRGEESRKMVDPGFVSVFRACNLQPALSLLEELDHSPKFDAPGQGPFFPGSQIPAHLSWLMATRPVFLYPELLSNVDVLTFHYKGPFTSAENCLVVLGHKHFQGTVHPLQLVCHYLLVARNVACLRAHIRSACQKQSPNIIKNYFLEGKYPSMTLACERVHPGDLRPPVEREKRLMPYWLSENLKLIYEEVRKYNQPPTNTQAVKDTGTTPAAATSTAISEHTSPSCNVPQSTRYPPWLPDSLAQALKPPPPGSSRRKTPAEISAQILAQAAESSKPSPPPKGVVEALGRFPPILPKSASPSLRTSLNIEGNAQSKKRSKSKSPSSGAESEKRAGETQKEAFKFTARNEERLTRTAPVVPASLENAREPRVTRSSAKVAPEDPKDGNVIISTTAPVATSLVSLPQGHIAGETKQINMGGSSVADSTSQGNILILPTTAVATALICPTPASKVVAQTPVSLTPLGEDQMSQRCGTLLKLSTGPGIPLGMKPPKSVPQNILHQLLILPPGCVIANGANCQNTNLDHEPVAVQKPCLAQDVVNNVVNVSHSLLGSHSLVCNADPLGTSSCKDLEDSFKDSLPLNETIEDEELDINETINNEEEQVECGEEGLRKPFLTLSESSGSLTPSLSGDDVAVETVMDEEEWEQREGADMDRETEHKHSKRTVEVISPASATSGLSVPELQESMEKLSTQVSEPRSEDKGLTDEVQSGAHASEERLLYDNCSDDDPRKDIKDVAFAQAYLKKAYEVLQVVPGKVEEFLGILYEFEQRPEGRTSVELFLKLKPVLRDWPELLRDFAAFLHPEQAQECGLLAEHQAFERSRRFLRQLELTFGEHSFHYRKVVRTLQQGPPKTLSASQEMKTQIALLFRDHTHLLEEYWVFFNQLHPPSQCRDTDEGHEGEDEVEGNDTDSVSSVQTVHSVETNHLCQPFRAHSPEKRTEALKSQIHGQKIDAITTEAECHAADMEMEEECSKERDAQLQCQLSGSAICAKNSSRTPSGEKVVLWTREADRVILTTCQHRGASPSTFSAIATQLSNKTATEVGTRYRYLIKLFHRSTKQHHTSRLDTELQSRPPEEEPD
ncbi:GON-4-like protein isoform X2 [Hoplias malabaricus]|uniref:GON-4-like protein isoform X2 n=1 Tax=Hoplias malabaricus TaxID=27720 RepID=UPI003461E777